jgi:tetratricopeptide (TPR) repeat protein
VAAAIEKLAPETRARRPEVLARHYTVAGSYSEAIDHWCRAGQLAIQRSAHGAAIVHLTEGLRLLAAEPPGPERTAREVTAQLALATSLTATLSYGAQEVGETLYRIRVLADELNDPAQQFTVRWTVWRFYFSRADFRAAEEIAVQLLQMADRQDDPVVRIGAHVAAGVDKFYLGDFSGVPTHLTRAMDLYDRARTADLILKYGQDIGVAAWGFLGWAHAVTGDLEGAASHARNMLELARDIGHPFSLALALFLGSEIHVLRVDRAAVGALAEELVALSREHSFTFFGALGTMFTGWTRVAGGDVRAGLALTREGAELFRVVGQQVGLAHRARLAEAFLASGAVDEALAATSDALDRWRQKEEAAFVAVHLRLRGEALAQTGDSAGARRAFTEAVDLARRQGAWLFALRAALSFARVDPGSLDVLRAIAERFPATHDSSDLEAARALLRAGP